MYLKNLPIVLFCLLTSSTLDAQILTSSNLPIVVINTNGSNIPDEPKIDASMGIIYNGEGMTNQLSDPFNYYDGNIGIETRGNSTQGFEKKTYSLELRDDNNEDLSVNLFGMGGEEDWILHAMVIDKSQLRIPMSFYWSQLMGHYASEWRFVEVVINHEYRGLYILTERIKRDDDRVDIDKLEEEDLSGDELTGGYILRIDWLEGDAGFESNYDSQGGIPMTFQWYYPKADNIQTEQADYIQSWMANFEEALYANDYTNSQGIRYDEYIDLDAFVDFLIINELSKNADGYKLSSYVYKDKDSRDGRLIAGPIWDFDQTYGVSEVCSCDDPTGWTYLQNQDDCEDLASMPMWWRAMMQDTVFQNRLDCRWTDFRSRFLHTDSIHTWIDEHVELTADAIDRNFTRWDNFIGEYIWFEPDPVPESYEEEITYLKDWIDERVQWLDDNFHGN
ncbi:MAG: CotH kinase family protein, partial [Bacteroidota bacterium]